MDFHATYHGAYLAPYAHPSLRSGDDAKGACPEYNEGACPEYNEGACPEYNEGMTLNSSTTTHHSIRWRRQPIAGMVRGAMRLRGLRDGT